MHIYISGMTNMGNLCFMNAVLQGLVGCSAFFRLLDSLKALTLPPELPTLVSLVNLAAEFVHVDFTAASDQIPSAAAAGAANGIPTPTRCCTCVA